MTKAYQRAQRNRRHNSAMSAEPRTPSPLHLPSPLIPLPPILEVRLHDQPQVLLEPQPQHTSNVSNYRHTALVSLSPYFFSYRSVLQASPIKLATPIPTTPHTEALKFRAPPPRFHTLMRKAGQFSNLYEVPVYLVARLNGQFYMYNSFNSTARAPEPQVGLPVSL